MRDYFCGWYFKCESGTQTLAVIPAVHRTGNVSSCSIQFITDDSAYNISFPHDNFYKSKSGFDVHIAENHFGTGGISLCLNTHDCTAEGSVSFGALSPIRYDIMGPFKYVPFMECRHSVVSMKHSVNGEFVINRVKYSFNNAVGYIEGDRGYSFPREYAWTQCTFDGGSLMLSVADIPFAMLHFTGIIGVIMRHGKEYRLATYLGARVVKNSDGELVIRQGDAVFSAKLIKKRACPLFAPIGGNMARTIHESAACRAAYSFKIGTRTIFDFETDKASFEYEY